MNPPAVADRSPGFTRRGVNPAAARHRVTELLKTAGVSLDSVTTADALLIATELVTNAIRHAGGVTHFHTWITDDFLHVIVGDASLHTPVPPACNPGPGGYGWRLVQRLADHVNITTMADGKTIHAILPLT
ncbi:ATP-binding protein [Streptomyces sp. NPDC054904]